MLQKCGSKYTILYTVQPRSEGNYLTYFFRLTKHLVTPIIFNALRGEETGVL